MAVDSICRVCMCQESDMTELFQPFSQEMINMIQFCTGILLKKEDCAPCQICTKCIQDLHIAHRFKMKCIDSDKVFQELAKINYGKIKSEQVIETSQRSFIKLEVCIDYDVLNEVHSSAELIEEPVPSESNAHSSAKLIEDVVSNKSNIKRSGRVRMKNNKLSLKKEKKSAGRRATLPSSKCKVNTRRGLRKFKRLYCEVCEVAFSSREESLEHKKRLHKEEKSWICEVCGKSYAHRSSQIAHMHSHYPARYACDHCDYSTYNKYDLIKHLRIHTGDKLYKCTQCSAAYRTSSNLRTHVRLMHERMRAHACHICGKTYNDRATLNRHIDAHNDIKRHVCEVCHSCFTRRCYWKKHLQKQHDIVIPSCRPGRPKAEVLLIDRS